MAGNCGVTATRLRMNAADPVDLTLTGDGIPEIVSRFSRSLTQSHSHGVLVLDNRGKLLAKIPEVTASSAGPYILRPRGSGTKPAFLLATTNVYRIQPKIE
ncbi:hypothetical protein JXJ21_15360 [candidate division KSB1 bacterium]|nr:hypothetical protein [candidate division KSB1 bacterium]